MQVQGRTPLLGGARGAPTGLVSPSKAQFLRCSRVPPGAGTEAQALGASAPATGLLKDTASPRHVGLFLPCLSEKQ